MRFNSLYRSLSLCTYSFLLLPIYYLTVFSFRALFSAVLRDVSSPSSLEVVCDLLLKEETTQQSSDSNGQPSYFLSSVPWVTLIAHKQAPSWRAVNKCAVSIHQCDMETCYRTAVDAIVLI